MDTEDPATLDDAAVSGGATGPPIDTYPPSPRWGDQAKLLVATGLVIAAALGIYLARNVIAIAALAAIIAFLLAPPIRWLQQKTRMPRALALLLTYFVVLVGIIFFGIIVAGAVTDAIDELDPAGLVEDARVWLVDRVEDLEDVTLFGVTIDLSEVKASLAGDVDEIGEGGAGSGALRITAQQALSIAGGLLGTVRSVFGLAAAIFTSAIVTALVAMYLNADSQRYHVALVQNVPPGYEGDALMLMKKVKKAWTGFMYGQLINSLITGTMVWLVLWAVGLRGAFLMGFIMAVLNMIPTFGPILAAIPGILAALVSGSSRFDMSNLWFAVLVTGIYVAVVQLQANVIAPKVMGDAVQLRPAVVLIGLMIGFAVGGLLGSLIVVPVIATLRDLFKYLYAKLIDRDPFPDMEPIEVVT